jgi:hypothetical protein
MLTSSKAWEDDEEPGRSNLLPKITVISVNLEEDGTIEVNHSETTDINIEGIQGR